MFRRGAERAESDRGIPDRVDSVLGPGINVKGEISGIGGVRIEGAFDGDISLKGIIVVGETGRLTCETLKANTAVISGSLRGDLVAERVEITGTGRVWGDVVTTSFSTEEGAFLRGKITMEEEVELGIEAAEAEEDPQVVDDD